MLCQSAQRKNRTDLWRKATRVQQARWTAFSGFGAKKMFKKLRNFRAGVEGNISELKHAFGAAKATWKGHDRFKAYFWSSVLSYNLIRMARFSSD